MYMIEVILTNLVMWVVEMTAIHRILITAGNDQESDNSDNAISSYGSENLSDDDGEELDIGKDFTDWEVKKSMYKNCFSRSDWNPSK